MWNSTDSKVSLEQREETRPLLRSQDKRQRNSIMGNEVEAGHKGDEAPPGYNDDDVARRDSVAAGIDDVAIIPKGVLDPVYEAKARVINRAVSFLKCSISGELLQQCLDVISLTSRCAVL